MYIHTYIHHFSGAPCRAFQQPVRAGSQNSSLLSTWSPAACPLKTPASHSFLSRLPYPFSRAPAPCLPPQNSWIFQQKVSVMSTSNLRSIGIYLRKCILPVVDLLVLVFAQSMSGYGELQFKCSKIVKNALYLRKNMRTIMHEC